MSCPTQKSFNLCELFISLISLFNNLKKTKFAWSIVQFHYTNLILIALSLFFFFLISKESLCPVSIPLRPIFFNSLRCRNTSFESSSGLINP